MSLGDFETSRRSGEPVELYKVQHGESVAMYYTDADLPIQYEGDTYLPHPIERENLESRAKLDRTEMRVTVPLTSPISDLFRIYPPGRVVNITIRQGHVPDPGLPVSWSEGENFPVLFQGRILEARRDENKCDLNCELVSASMKRPGLRRHYQWPCPLVLYGSRCQADKGAGTAAVTVSALTGNTATLASPWIHEGRAGRDYVGGTLSWPGALGWEQRTVLRVEGDELTLDGPLTDLVPGASANVVLGCPHTLEGCRSLHSNAVNFGGHPYIPAGTNPIGKNNYV